MAPTTNTYFSSTTGYSGEQQLIDSLVIEQIAIFGLDLMYMPRENVNLDRLLHESTKDVFSLAMSIPMYVKSYDGYDNSMEMLTKFGIRSSDELTLVMSRSQWSTYYAPYVKSMYNADSNRSDLAQNNPLEGQTSKRPKEGDLIFFPFDGGMFEIKYVQFDQPFFQLGKGYIYELQCEKFEYSGEDFNTGIVAIDETSPRSAFPNIEFLLKEGGTSTFEFQEKVRIFDLTAIELTQTDDIKNFQFTDDSGVIRSVPYVEATVASWNITTRKLSIDNVSDMAPDQLNRETGNVDINEFDVALIVGQTSGATWYSVTAGQKPKPFDDSAEIQKEFNKIKIYDPVDTSPFGFY